MKLIALLISLNTLLASQSKGQIIKYEYKSERNYALSKYYNFISTRTFLKDSTFTDSRMLCASDKSKICSITFKKNKNEWLIKANGNWQKFYVKGDTLLRTVEFEKDKFRLRAIGYKKVINGRKLYGFIQDFYDVNPSDRSFLWFDPDFGIVLFEGSMDLYRNDFIEKNPLTTPLR